MTHLKHAWLSFPPDMGTTIFIISKSVDEAIAGIEAGKWKFWTAGGGKSVWVVIAVHMGRKYLKTEADGLHPNNLLSLPECP